MREMKMVGRRAVQSGKQSLAPLARAGIYFRTNRPCRLPPAHQGMRSGGAGWWKRFGVISATPATPWIPAFAGMTKGGCVASFSYQGRGPSVLGWGQAPALRVFSLDNASFLFSEDPRRPRHSSPSCCG